MLKEAVVALGIEQAFSVEACFLEHVIHVGGDHKVVLIGNEPQKVLIDGLWRFHIAVAVDIPAPPGPISLLIREGIEAAGIHIRDDEALCKIREVAHEALAIVDKARRGGKPRSRTNHDGVCRLQFMLKAFKLFRAGADAHGQSIPEPAHTVQSFLNGLLVAVRPLSIIPAHSILYPHP